MNNQPTHSPLPEAWSRENEITVTEGLSISQYLGVTSDVVSSSRIRDFINESPLYYFKKYVTNEIKCPASKAMGLGNAIDCHITQGKAAFECLYGMDYPDKKPTKSQLSSKNPSERTIELIKDYGYWEKRNVCKTILSRNDYLTTQHCVNSLYSSDFGKVFKENTSMFKTQSTFRINLEDISVQCRPDIFKVEGDRVRLFDLKSTARLRDWSYNHRGNPLYKFGYYIQCGLYSQFLQDHFKKRVDCYLWVVETQQPYESALLRVPQYIVDAGLEACQRAIGGIRECFKSNKWPGVFNGESEIELNCFL